MIDQKYFVVIDHHEFDLHKHLLRQYGRIALLHFIEFTIRALDNPAIEPLCIYYENGIRKYLWKDKVFLELDIPADWFERELRKLIKQEKLNEVAVIGYQSLLKFMDKYRGSSSPTLLDDVDKVDLRSYNKTFHRILYEIIDIKCAGNW